jgi:hypothetical protein
VRVGRARKPITNLGVQRACALDVDGCLQDSDTGSRVHGLGRDVVVLGPGIVVITTAMDSANRD